METALRKWIEEIIAIPSVTDTSNQALVDWLKPKLEAAGLQVELHPYKEGRETFYNLIAFTHASYRENIFVMNTHLDTVHSGERSLWTQGPPFKATWKGNKVYGLGSADVKIDILCKLWALMHSKPWKFPIALVGTYGEERGLVGAKQLLDSKIIKPRYALVGEPSNLEIIYAHKGHLIIRAYLPFEKKNNAQEKKWSGVAAHSSTPHLGKSALEKALEEIFKKKMGISGLQAGTDSNRLPEVCVGLINEEAGDATAIWKDWFSGVQKIFSKYNKKSDRRFSPSKCTLSWNRCLSQGKECELLFDVRLLPDTKIDPLLKEFRQLAENLLIRIEVELDPALSGSKDSLLIAQAEKALKHCGVKPKIKTKASSTEAAIYQRAGAEAIVFGPGVSIGNVHKPNEHNLVDQIELATRFYSVIVRKFGELV